MKKITLLVVILAAAFLLIAAAPFQDAPPGENAPPVSIIDSIVGVVVLALGGFVAWLVAQVRALKKQAIDTIRAVTPDNWEWVVEQQAYIFVRAAYQQFPLSETTKMLKYAQDGIYAMLAKNGILIDQAARDKIRAIIDSACADFYLELGKPELIGYSPVTPGPTETANSR